MKLNIWTLVLLAGIMAFSGSSLCRAQEETMTNTQLAGILVDVLGLEMPADVDTLSEAELFEIQANMLAESGITLFVDAKPDAQVTRGAVANVLYDALIGLSDATTQDKVGYLASLGYISAGAAADVISSAEVIVALNVPALSSAVAEAYSPPPGRLGRPGPPPPGRRGAPPRRGNPAPEGPASPV